MGDLKTQLCHAERHQKNVLAIYWHFARGFGAPNDQSSARQVLAFSTLSKGESLFQASRAAALRHTPRGGDGERVRDDAEDGPLEGCRLLS